MARALNLSLLHKPPASLLPLSNISSHSHLHSFSALCSQLRCKARFSCLFNDNRKQEQARKALESALGGNKEKYEKWNQEIEKREKASGGGDAGGGGWFGWGGRFGWFNDDNFWQEAQQTILTILGILVLYLVAAKGELLLAITLNPLLFGLRSTRNAFTYIMSWLTRMSYPTNDAKLTNAPMEPAYGGGAKSRVMKKWGAE